jgi:hypothetical protein
MHKHLKTLPIEIISGTELLVSTECQTNTYMTFSAVFDAMTLLCCLGDKVEKEYKVNPLQRKNKSLHVVNNKLFLAL